MKKSERTKIKLETLRKLKSNLDFSKRLLKRNWRYRYSSKLFKEDYRVAIKTDFANIHSNLFTLRVVEKQIPMPVKIQVEIPTKVKCFYNSGKKILVFHYKAYCQKCNRTVNWGIKPSDLYGYAKETTKYCPYCGQKLWWPSSWGKKLEW